MCSMAAIGLPLSLLVFDGFRYDPRPVDHSACRVTTQSGVSRTGGLAMRRIVVLLVIAAMMPLSVPAGASPTEPFSEVWIIDCDGVDVSQVYEEWS
mgnify:CR=1 FL=1